MERRRKPVDRIYGHGQIDFAPKEELRFFVPEQSPDEDLVRAALRGNSVPAQIDSGHHQRTAPRYKLFQPTHISASGTTRRVHVLNISVGGAMLYAQDPPPPGAILRVRCGTQSLSARVAWSEHRRFGVAFITPLSAAGIDEIIAVHDALVAAASQSRA